MADLSITAANVLASTAAEIRREYNAGATITAGQLVYLDSNNKWQLVDTDAGATGNAVTTICGIALAGASNNQPLSVAVADTGFTPGATLTVGKAYFASVNAGAIADTAPSTNGYTRFVGIGKTAAVMVLKPVCAGVAVP
jgi:hypothetical protein